MDKKAYDRERFRKKYSTDPAFRLRDLKKGDARRARERLARHEALMTEVSDDN